MAKLGCTPRIQRLREQYLKHKPSICLERALVYTKVFKETEGEPIIIRRAKAFKRYCETKTLLIQDDELIVGNVGYQPRVAAICPEINAFWLSRELDTIATRPQDPYAITDDQKKILKEVILPYWGGKTVIEHWFAQVPEDTKELSWETGIIDCEIKSQTGPGEFAIGYGNVLFPKGFNGIKRDAEERLKSLDPADPDNVDKINFLKAVILCCEGMAILGKRHAEKAKEMAKKENPKRRAELEKIAEVCNWVPANPPRTFHEALQTIWFVQIGLFIELNAPSYSIGRFDQFMYPYYKKDVKERRLTKEHAQGLLECLWIKLSEQCWCLSNNSAYYFSGGANTFQNLTVGGVTPDGKDATNELSFMCIQATMDVRLSQPSLAVRLHKLCPEEFLLKVCELIRLGTGFPAVHNDEIGIKMLLRKGARMEEARDWCLVGCVEPNLGGKLHQWSDVGHYNFGSAVEFALTNGIHIMTGKRLGLETGDPRAFKTFEEFKEAAKEQLAYQIRNIVISSHIIEKAHSELCSCPLASSLVLDCVENGKCLMDGGARYNIGPGTLGIGLADGVNSLAAVKKLIYDDKVITWDELLEALSKNFEGYEYIRQLCLNAQKWGNDIDQVDELGVELADFIVKEHEKYRTLCGEYLMPSLYPVSSHVPQGTVVGALPSGRKAGEPLADGISPNHGTDGKGPTAVLKSISKINHEDVDGATLLNLKFDPSVLKGDKGLRRLAAFLRTFMDLGAYHVQFNVVSAETLRDAQRHPDQYLSMLVRVAGYSAYFVELCREIQEDIIARTTHAGL